MSQKHQAAFIVFVLLLAAFAVVFMKAAVEDAQSPASVAAVSLSAEAGFFDVGGRKFTLADFRGKVVLVNLWATWCPPCVAELPSLDRLQALLKDRNFAVVAISLDRGDMKTVTDFLEKRGVEHLTAYWDRDRDVPLKWKYEGLPVSFLLDEKGAVIEKFDGPREWHEGDVFRQIEKALPVR